MSMPYKVLKRFVVLPEITFFLSDLNILHD